MIATGGGANPIPWGEQLPLQLYIQKRPDKQNCFDISSDEIVYIASSLTANDQYELKMHNSAILLIITYLCLYQVDNRRT